MLDIVNSSSETVITNPKEEVGILDLRSLGYYKIQQGILPIYQLSTNFINYTIKTEGKIIISKGNTDENEPKLQYSHKKITFVL